MWFPSARAFMVLPAVIASSFAFANRPAAGADCSQAVDQTFREIEEFKRDAEKENMSFVVDEGVDAAIADASKMLKAKTAPTLDGAAAMEKHVNTLETWEQIQEAFGVGTKELVECLTPGSGCKLTEFIAKQNKAFQRYMQTYLSEGTQTALRRAERARDVMQKHVARLAGNAERSIHAAVGCMHDYQQRAQAAHDADLRGGRAAGGASAGQTVAGVALGLGIAGGVTAYVLSKEKDAAGGGDASSVTGIAFTGGVGGFGSFSNFQITPALSNIGVTCTWTGNAGSRATRTTTTSPAGTGTCSNSDVASWPDGSIVIKATVTGTNLSTSRTY